MESVCFSDRRAKRNCQFCEGNTQMIRHQRALFLSEKLYNTNYTTFLLSKQNSTPRIALNYGFVTQMKIEIGANISTAGFQRLALIENAHKKNCSINVSSTLSVLFRQQNSTVITLIKSTAVF